MKTLRNIAILADKGQLVTDGKVVTQYRRILLPMGSEVETSGLFSVSKSSGLQYYPGKFPESVAFIQWPVPQAQADQFLIEDTISRDIAALLGYVFHRRIVVADEVKLQVEGSTLTTLIPACHKVDSRLYVPIQDKPDAIWEMLQKMFSMEADDQFDALADAMRLYHGATVVAEVDYSAAYLLLVSAMESLAATFEQGVARFEDWSEASAWDNWIADAGLSKVIADQLRSRLVDNRALRLRQRFISVGLRAATEDFWSLPWEHAWTKQHIDSRGKSTFKGIDTGEQKDVTPAAIERDNLRSILGRVYDFRSALVHAGSPFPALTSLDFPSLAEFDLPNETGKAKKVAIPSLAWFERLVWFAIGECLRSADKDDTYRLPDVRIDPVRY